MPTYDFRCNNCGRSFALFYKSYKDYEAAESHICPNCQSTEVTRRIRKVAIGAPSRDFANMSSNEMLSVMEGGDSREVGKMFQQVADTTGEDLGATYRETADRLLKGESMDSVERDLASRTGGGDED